MQDKVGLSGVDMMPQMMMGGGMPAGGAVGGTAAPVEEEAPKVEKDIFDVKLDSFDAASKIKVIKEVRAITGLGLKEVSKYKTLLTTRLYISIGLLLFVDFYTF